MADEGTPLTAATFELGAAAWEAFRSPDPAGLRGITRARSPELRFLGEAFGRLLQEYPSRTDGLSLTQRRILLAATSDAAPAARIFRAVSDLERQPFLGDTSFDVCLRELAECGVPLLVVGDAVRVTAAGKKVLAGREDHARLSGIDRWIGGVHLQGREPRWRYDERLESFEARLAPAARPRRPRPGRGALRRSAPRRSPPPNGRGSEAGRPART